MSDHVLSEPPGWSLVWSDEFVWEPDRIRWYLDDQLYRTLTPGDLRGNPWGFDHDFFLLLNVAVGGSFSRRPDSSTALPQTMLIDHIRVYTPEPPPPRPSTR